MFTRILSIKKETRGSNVKNIKLAIVIDYPYFFVWIVAVNTEAAKSHRT